MASEIKSRTSEPCQISLEMLEIWKRSAQLKSRFLTQMSAEGSGHTSCFAGGILVFSALSRHRQAQHPSPVVRVCSAGR